MMIIASLIHNLLSPIFASATCSNSFFGFPVWWKYIKPQPTPPDCTVTVTKFPDDLWAIGFAAIDMLLYAAGIVAVVSIIAAGISYITSAGNTDGVAAAQKRIVNSLIGLIIVMFSILIVSFIGSKLG